MKPALTELCRRSPSLTLLALSLWLGALAGCKVGPNYAPPAAPVAGVWHQRDQGGVVWQSTDIQTWWTDFDDPLLVHLVGVAIEQNLTLAEAMERIEQARSVRQGIRGDLFPDASAEALYARRQVSGNGNPFVVSQTAPFSFLSAGFDAVWELDVWGKYRRALEAADAEWDASINDYYAVHVSLTAEVAANYVTLRTFQQRIAIARANADIQRKTVEFIEPRVTAGLNNDLALAQARSNLFQTLADIPTLQRGQRETVNRLCVLRGEPPHSLISELGDLGKIPATHPEILVGLPAELLRRRPDVLQAENLVASESARIGVAVADMLPQVTLRGNIELNSHELRKWFTAESLAADYGPSIRWNILNFGRLRNRVRAQESRHLQAVLSYQDVVLTALEEVENAMAAYVLEQQRVEQLVRGVDAAEQAVKLAAARYKQGLIGFLDLLQTQTTLLSLQDQLAVSQGNVALNRIAIYKALGGGWEGATHGPGDHLLVRLESEPAATAEELEPPTPQ